MTQRPRRRGAQQAVPLMPSEAARDIARGLKWLADRYAEAEMPDEAAAVLRDSEWWLGYARTLPKEMPQ